MSKLASDLSEKYASSREGLDLEEAPRVRSLVWIAFHERKVESIAMKF